MALPLLEIYIQLLGIAMIGLPIFGICAFIVFWVKVAVDLIIPPPIDGSKDG